MLKRYKDEILKNHCYTELVYFRINKKLGRNFSNEESEVFIEKILTETVLENYEKIGKNIYVTNKQHNLKITINSNTFRIITVDKI